MTPQDIKYLQRQIDFDELTEIFDWDLAHWQEMMKDMTENQYKRFIALKLTYQQTKDGKLDELIDFLDQFGIKRLK